MCFVRPNRVQASRRSAAYRNRATMRQRGSAYKQQHVQMRQELAKSTLNTRVRWLIPPFICVFHPIRFTCCRSIYYLSFHSSAFLAQPSPHIVHFPIIIIYNFNIQYSSGERYRKGKKTHAHTLVEMEWHTIHSPEWARMRWANEARVNLSPRARLQPNISLDLFIQSRIFFLVALARYRNLLHFTFPFHSKHIKHRTLCLLRP